MTQFYSYLPSEDDFEISLYYAELRNGGGKNSDIPIYLTAYDVVGQDGFSQLLLAIAPEKGECCVTTFWKITPMDIRPSTAYDFTFEGRDRRYFIFFGLLIFMPVFMVMTAISCALNKQVSKKWLWIPFILIGFWGAQLNWATGDIQNDFFTINDQVWLFSILSFKLLGAGFIKSGPFQPWIISIAIPVGAILYWLTPARRAPKPDNL